MIVCVLTFNNKHLTIILYIFFVCIGSFNFKKKKFLFLIFITLQILFEKIYSTKFCAKFIFENAIVSDKSLSIFLQDYKSFTKKAKALQTRKNIHFAPKHIYQFVFTSRAVRTESFRFFLFDCTVFIAQRVGLRCLYTMRLKYTPTINVVYISKWFDIYTVY